MKKFLAGVVTGHVLTSVAMAYSLGYFHRAIQFAKWEQEHGVSDQSHWSELFAYMTQGIKPSFVSDIDPENYAKIRQQLDEINTKAWVQRIKRVHAMIREGYSVTEIAEHMDIPESKVQELHDDLAEYEAGQDLLDSAEEVEE